MARIIDLRKKQGVSTVPVIPQRSVQPQPHKEPPRISPTRENSISWEAPSFYYNPQKRYFALVIIALLAGASSIIIFGHNNLLAIFLILSSLVLILYANKRPTIAKVTVSQTGVKIDELSYPYRDMKSFWIEYNPGGIKELSLESKKWYMPYVKVLLEEQNPIQLRTLMINFLPEKEHENSLIDHLARKIGL